MSHRFLLKVSCGDFGCVTSLHCNAIYQARIPLCENHSLATPPNITLIAAPGLFAHRLRENKFHCTAKKDTPYKKILILTLLMLDYKQSEKAR